jgi:hypothetical protein
MARSNPYVGHSDFYLLDLWQGRAQLKESELQALREEMSQRGLEVDVGPGAAEPYRQATEGAVGQPCPVCGGRMRDGELSVHKETSEIGGLPRLVGRVEGLATHLYFRQRGQYDTIVVPYSESRPGALCEDCGSVIVRGLAK